MVVVVLSSCDRVVSALRTAMPKPRDDEGEVYPGRFLMIKKRVMQMVSHAN